MRWVSIILMFPCLAHGWTNNWQPEAWPSPDNVRISTQLQVEVQAVQISLVYPSYIGPFTNGPGTNTGTMIHLTNSFLDEFKAPPLDTNEVVTSWVITAISSNGLPEQHYLSATNFYFLTNVSFQARDVWAMDSYQAAYERSLVVGDGLAAPIRPRFYRNNREALVEVKDWIASSAGYFINPTSALPAAVTNWLVDLPWLTVSSLLVMADCPSNYLDSTPWRALAGDTNSTMGRVVTSLFTISTSSSNTLTITNLMDACGNAVVISGTNGQQITMVCTNTEIMPGYTTADYGWAAILRVFSFLTRLGYETVWDGQADYSASTARWYEIGGEYCDTNMECLFPLPYGTNNMVQEHTLLINSFPWTDFAWFNEPYLGPAYAMAWSRVDHTFIQGDWSDPPNWTWFVSVDGLTFNAQSISPAIYWQHTNSVSPVGNSTVYHRDMVPNSTYGMTQGWFTVSTSTVYRLQHAGAATNKIGIYNSPPTGPGEWGFESVTGICRVLFVNNYTQSWFNSSVGWDGTTTNYDFDEGGPVILIGAGEIEDDTAWRAGSTYMVIDYLFDRR